MDHQGSAGCAHEGTRRLRGRVSPGGEMEAEELRLAAAEAWWSSWPSDKAIVLALHIDQAVFVGWDTEQGVMTVDRWSSQDGYSQSHRTYP